MKPSLILLIEKALSGVFGKPVTVSAIESVPGGSINETWKTETSAGSFFIKSNDPEKFPGMFEAEKRGLRLLKNNSSVKIPEVIAVSESKKESILILEFMESGETNAFERFAELLSGCIKKAASNSVLIMIIISAL
ncbi:MAG TPA: fructosamine kinase family protein [Bacteroidia bacterium]|jgi:hypothetical protein